jgi:hypothetical protein
MSLDLFGLKAQVLGRIEVLDARESEWEELHSELIPAMERRRHGSGVGNDGPQQRRSIPLPRK